ncbi:MAG: sulfite exporter TauE/SafE family protein [Bacteroidota bacterium]
MGRSEPGCYQRQYSYGGDVCSGASGYSHYKFGNVNKKLFKALVIPGVLGAIAGAMLLVFFGNKYGDFIRPIIATYTLILGVKFILNAFRKTSKNKKV